jgi:squalene-hopene/tetraprenyl-beta-curcumene cyclase
MNAIERNVLTAAIERTQRAVFDLQLGDGRWNGDEDLEPLSTAQQLVTEHFLDRLTPDDAEMGSRFLVTLQREDGSFPGYPFAQSGDFSTTALVYAALHVAGAAAAEPAKNAALAFVDRNGGLPAVAERFRTHSDPTALLLAMAGLISPFDLPNPKLLFSLCPPLIRFMERRINGGVIMQMMGVGGITRCLRERQRRSGWLRRIIHRMEAACCVGYHTQFQNPNGNWNGVTTQTDMGVAALHAFGVPPDDQRMSRALQWLEAHKIRDGKHLRVQVFTSEVWTTALTMRALLHSGIPRDAQCIVKALEFLVSAQSMVPMPRANQRKWFATRIGGWPFEIDNVKMVDCDDTGTVLSVLGLALQQGHDPQVPPETADRVQAAIDLGVRQLCDMQNPEGGWAGFVYGMPEKPAGPIFDKPISVPNGLREMLQFFFNPPVELGNPAVSGLTGRVLTGLGHVGYNADSREVQRAAAFLRVKQYSNDAWWCRWLVNYVLGTTSVISGLADVHHDMSAPWIDAAFDWLRSRQNDDGGWGERPESYADPNKAGVGPSMPPVTGHVLTAFLDAGRGEDPAVLRGIRYLLENQFDDGLWSSEEWLQTYLPPDMFYYYDAARWYSPLEALGKYRSFLIAGELG